MRRAEMLLLKSLAETLMADRDNRHDDLQATMRLAHLSSPEMILYMVNRVLELEESIERIAAVLQKLSADEPMPPEETPPEPAFEPAPRSPAPPRARKTQRRAGRRPPAPGECWRSAHAPVAPPAPPPALWAPAPGRAGSAWCRTAGRSADVPHRPRSRSVRDGRSSTRPGRRRVRPPLFSGRRAISSDEAVTGPQQSWQPGLQAKPGICRRNWSIWRPMQLMGNLLGGEGLYSADRSIPKVPVRMLSSEPNRPVQPALSVPGQETARLPVRPPVHGYLPSRRSRAR